MPEDIIDWAAFQGARADLGADFVRILGYFREDGAKSLDAIETAMRAQDAVALVVPAHTLKGEARQFGAEALGDLAEEIEVHARQCVEWKTTPEDALPSVVKLRPLFVATFEAFDKDINPLMRRPQSFGRKAGDAVRNQGFGRL
ncbi:MAG: Hpt domain-containing protein [Sphingomonadaceae bacterium]